MNKNTVLFGILLILGISHFACSEKKCDRACLVSLMDQYLAAVVKHNPTGLPIADDVKFIENLKTAPVGKGLWETATGGPTQFKIHVADPVAGQVGFMGVIQDKGKPVLLGARLKLVKGKITEIDHMVSPVNEPMPAGLLNPRAGLITKISDSERVSREQMLKAANAYYDAIEQSDGNVAPFADECQRHEGGITSANNQDPLPPGAQLAPGSIAMFGRMKCGPQLSTGIMGYITDINQRRLFAVDEEMGLVMAYSMFNHDGEPNPLKIKGVPDVTESPNNWGKFTVPAAHIYKIKGGKIYEIEAMAIVGVPYQTGDGWHLPRKGLVDLMDQYLAALPKHDPSLIPLAKEAKLVENTKKTPIGEGLWKTATGGPTDFKVYAADVDQQQIGFIGVIENEKKPAIVSVRLKVENGRITEIDHLVVPAGDNPLHPNMSQVRPALLTRQLKLERVPRERMREIANSYYEAIVQDNGKVAPFADECQRRENGGISANDQTQTPEEAAKDDFSVFRKMSCSDQLSTGVMSYITDINRRRVFAIDEEMGLVFAYSIFVHDGNPKVMKITGVPGITERKNDYGPFDLPAAHIFKIRNGKIYEIEAIGYMAEHGIKNGWE
ncbi:MAG: hypothetical protein JXA73_16215 [Acidobacteria bacterium]|nr:hypothetical protein [Acidobacteriota bacterium]